MPISIFIIAIFSAVLLFAAGIAVGVWLTMFGYKMGFRASYQIRGEPQDSDKSLLGVNDSSQELEIAAEENKVQTNIMSEE